MADRHYIRWRGQVSGPFDSAEVRAMLAEGQISRHHQVSSDGTHWQTVDQSGLAATAPSAAPAAALSATPGQADAARSSPAPPPAAKAALRKMPAKLRRKVSAEDLDWLYVEDDTVMGPIGFVALRGLAESGVLDADTKVSPAGDEDWRPLRDVVPLEPLPPVRPAAPQRGVIATFQNDAPPVPTTTVGAGKYCPSCGRPLALSAVLCPACGAALQKDSSVSGGTITTAYVLALLFPVLGLAMAVYLLVKGRVGHAIGVAVLSLCMIPFWVGFIEALG
jgi:hypothetical protein